jgi:hypothetical protein
MSKIVATALLKSNTAFHYLTCFSNVDHSKTVRTDSNQRPTVVSGRTSGSFVYCGCKASNLRVGSNYINTVARTISVKARSL